MATVWEPGLAFEMASFSTAGMAGDPLAPPVDVAEARELGDTLQAEAERLAREGADLARSAGLEAEAVPVADERNDVAESIIDLARDRGAAAVVIGSRGRSGLLARLEGSTSRGVLKHAECPVVVVHDA